MSAPDYADRRRRLLRLLKQNSFPGILITHPVNVSYLSGFTGDDSYLLLTPTETVVISDSRYEEQLQTECPDCRLEIRRPPVKMLDQTAKVVTAAGMSDVALEAGSVSWELVESLRTKLPTVNWKATSGLVESLREIKDKFEIEAIRHAIQVAQRAFGVLRASIRPESTEKELADLLEYQIRLFGGTCSSFPAIIGVGPRAALPHGRPSDKAIHESEFVLIDWGARAGGYISDLTRVLTTGRIPPKLERLYGVVLKGQLAAIDAIRPGALLKEVDAAARDSIAAAGFGKNFSHSLGHGIGMQVHEAPRLAMDQEAPLRAGMVITIEPGIYFPGWGGIRIEDDILVTKDGHEVLSSVPKDFHDCVLN